MSNTKQLDELVDNLPEQLDGEEITHLLCSIIVGYSDTQAEAREIVGDMIAALGDFYRSAPCTCPACSSRRKQEMH